MKRLEEILVELARYGYVWMSALRGRNWECSVTMEFDNGTKLV
jgi:hypothetical protein